MRILEYMLGVTREAANSGPLEADNALDAVPRWELFKAFAEPIRLRLLALVSIEELSIGELAQLTGESQPNVSRHVASLRQIGVVTVTKHGTRSMLRVTTGVRQDAVVEDAIANGLKICQSDGSAARVAIIVAERDAVARDFFSRPTAQSELAPPPEGLSYLAALSHLLPRRELAVDIGTGDGGLLEVLSPSFHRVVGIDRSETQLALARRRVNARGFTNVELGVQELGAVGTDDSSGSSLVAPGSADAVFAVRVLHHAAVPRKLLQQLLQYCAPGGALVLIDYAPHDDEKMREQGDVWQGFAPAELKRMAESAGFESTHIAPIPAPHNGPDAHLPWQVMVAKRPLHSHGKSK